MSEIELLNPPIYQCRYCLGDDMDGLISPCKCSGSSKYVHKECLKKWFSSRSQRYVIPGAFRQYTNVHSCELCKTSYRVEKTVANSGESLNCKLFQYFSTLTIVLVGMYASIGYLMSLDSSTKYLFLEYDNYWENTIANGFAMTHLTIGILYIIVSIVSVSSSSGCILFYPMDCSGGNGDGDCFAIIIITIILIGLIGTVLFIYYDVLGRVIQRHNLKKIEVLDIMPFPEDSEV